jgi:hypothetical protein
MEALRRDQERINRFGTQIPEIIGRAIMAADIPEWERYGVAAFQFVFAITMLGGAAMHLWINRSRKK